MSAGSEKNMTAQTTAMTPAQPAPARLLLPGIRLPTSANSRQLEQRFNYLWATAHAVVGTNATLAHTMMASIMDLARLHRMPLPAAVLDYVCAQCGGLVVPSITADVRVQPQRPRGTMNRALARRQRLGRHQRRERAANAVHLRCHRCGHINTRVGVAVAQRLKLKKRPRDQPEGEDHATAGSVTLGEGQTPNKRPKTSASEAPVEAAVGVESAAPPPPSVPAPRSVFAAPASPPRKLLDGKKRKKKSKAPEAGTSAVKSSLNSLLGSLRPSFAK